MYTNLVKSEIIQRCRVAADKTGLSPYSLVKILGINSDTVENGEHIEEILARIENGEAQHIDSNNNQFTYYDTWLMDGFEYTITHFPNGDFVIDETLPLDPSDFV